MMESHASGMLMLMYSMHQELYNVLFYCEMNLDNEA